MAIVGVVGGGQLGRMLAQAANRLGIKIVFLEKGADSPAKQITAHDEHVQGPYSDRDDPSSIRQLGKLCDVITIEIEHVNAQALEELSRQGGAMVEPSPSTIRLIQNKYRQKKHLEAHRIAVAPFVEVEAANEDGLRSAGQSLGYPYMLKAQTDAYDGYGNAAVMSEAEIPAALERLGQKSLYAEKWSNFERELAVVVVKTKDGVLSYRTVETVHEDSICKLVFCPPRQIPREVDQEAQQLARDAVASFPGKGVFAVEMFLLHEGDRYNLQVNEIAPRVHNSGHLTIEACRISQFEAHLRAILDLPISQTDLELREPAIMLNILGGSSPTSHLEVRDAAYHVPGAAIHLYGKAEAKPGRKMGHITVTNRDIQTAYNTIHPLILKVDQVRASRPGKELGTSPPAPKLQPLVLVVMGSRTDEPEVEDALSVLRDFGIRYRAQVRSAHRSVDEMIQAGRSAAGEGFKVIIAAAGGSAHLPGMIAATTTLPVIAIPVKGKSFDGMDAVYSSLQMPNGTPVTLVGVGRAKNAGFAAARILGAYDGKIEEALFDYKAKANKESMKAGKDLEEEQDKIQDEAARR